jgi:hypothetical protein
VEVGRIKFDLTSAPFRVAFKKGKHNGKSVEQLLGDGGRVLSELIADVSDLSALLSLCWCLVCSVDSNVLVCRTRATAC